MSEIDGVLQEIINDPDNDGPRLVYADLVSSRGDADRAEFIRVQCRLARLSADDPERSALTARETELLEQHALHWAEELRPNVYQWAYRRGFVECADMNLEVTGDEIVSVLRRAPIRYLRQSNQICDLSGLVQALPHMARMLGLELWAIYVVEDALVSRILGSEHLRNLKTLVLHHDRNGNMIGDSVIIDGLLSPHRSSLIQLGVNIDGTWRGPSTDVLRAMARSPHLRNLRRLCISNAGDTGNRARMDVDTARRIGVSPSFARL